MHIWSDTQHRNGENVNYPRVFVMPLSTEDLFEDAYMLLARDGAGMIEIQLRLQKSLLALARLGDEEYCRAALRQSQRAQERAETALTLPADLERLQSAIARNQPPIRQGGERPSPCPADPSACNRGML